METTAHYLLKNTRITEQIFLALDEVNRIETRPLAVFRSALLVIPPANPT
jgi:hypothetical protein